MQSAKSRLSSFFYHYMLVTFSDEPWIDWLSPGTDLQTLIENNEDGDQNAWTFKNNLYDEKAKEINFPLEDAVTLMSDDISAGALSWLNFVIHYIYSTDTVDSATTLMHSMGCGSSDSLLASTVIAAMSEISPVSVVGDHKIAIHRSSKPFEEGLRTFQYHTFEDGSISYFHLEMLENS